MFTWWRVEIGNALDNVKNMRTRRITTLVKTRSWDGIFNLSNCREQLKTSKRHKKKNKKDNNIVLNHQ